MIATLAEAERASDGPLIVPMTIVRDDFDEIVGGLCSLGVEVRHYTLAATSQTLHRSSGVPRPRRRVVADPLADALVTETRKRSFPMSGRQPAISLDLLEASAYIGEIWQVEATNQAQEWLESLDADSYDSIAAAIDTLEQRGPSLGRPLVDSIKGSRHHNMKELRSVGGNLRALFCFDPRRAAIILLGGDKTNNWAGWYEENIPLADDLYDTYLAELRQEGLL